MHMHARSNLDSSVEDLSSTSSVPILTAGDPVCLTIQHVTRSGKERLLQLQKATPKVGQPLSVGQTTPACATRPTKHATRAQDDLPLSTVWHTKRSWSALSHLPERQEVCTKQTSVLPPVQLVEGAIAAV
jgi:hypothetical protein